MSVYFVSRLDRHSSSFEIDYAPRAEAPKNVFDAIWMAASWPSWLRTKTLAPSPGECRLAPDSS